jgi:hypothetical protein
MCPCPLSFLGAYFVHSVSVPSGQCRVAHLAPLLKYEHTRKGDFPQRQGDITPIHVPGDGTIFIFKNLLHTSYTIICAGRDAMN